MITSAPTLVLPYYPSPPPPPPGLTVEPTTQQPPPNQQDAHPVTDAVLITALAAWLASLLLWSGSRLPKRIMVHFGQRRISARAVRAVLELLRRAGVPSSVLSAGIAARLVASGEWLRMAAFVLASSGRITEVLDDGGSLVDALKKEQRYFDQYEHAAENRSRAADKSDKAAKLGLKLEWVTTMDGRADKECIDLNGTIFAINDPPNGIYPGMMHPYCRCKPKPVKE
jgi:SPP1 gp7 family putative phage head morphogenesis protein